MPIRAVSWSDAEVRARLLAGDERALGRVLDAHGPRLVTIASRITGDRVAGEDVAQEVVVDLWCRPERFDPERGSLATFLSMVVRRRALDWLRRSGAARRRDERELRERLHGLGDVGPEVAAIATADADAVQRAVAALPGDQRDAVSLAYFGGHTFVEVAELLAVPEGTAKSRIRLGLRRLRATLAGVREEIV